MTTPLPEIHYDDTYRIDYNPVSHKFRFDKNVVGVPAAVSISVASFTYTDINSVFISKSGNDTNLGTQASPRLTITAAANICTAVKQYVVVLDSGQYVEELDGITNEYFNGLYAATGQTPTYIQLDATFTPTDANSRFVKKTGNDTTGDGTQALPYLTITKAISMVDATHQTVAIMDSETYDEANIAYAGNFVRLMGMLGQSPTVITYNDDLIVTQIISETKILDSTRQYVSAVKKSNGDIVIAYVHSTYGKYTVFDSEYNVIKSETTFHAASTMWVSLAINSNDDIIIGYCDYSDAGKGKYIVLDTDYNVIKTETVFESNSTTGISIAVNSDDDIIFAFNHYSAPTHTGQYLVLDSSYTEIKAATIFSDSIELRTLSITVNLNDDIIFAYSYSDGSMLGYYKIIDESYTEIKAQTLFHNALTDTISCLTNVNNEILFFYRDVSDSGRGKYLILSSDYSILISETIFSNSDLSTYSIKSFFIGSNDFIIFYNKGADLSIFYQTFNISREGLEVNVNAECINLNLTDKWDSYNYITGSYNLTLKNCEIEGIENSLNTAKISLLTGQLIAYNLKLHDCDEGLKATNNNIVIKYNQAYRINGKAFYADGAGAGIDIQHNSFQLNGYDIYLENNAGTEIVKNNNHNDSGSNVYAETALTVSYSCGISASRCVNVTLSHCTSANPLYLDPGEYDPDVIDFHVMLRVMGNYTDSPAYGLADDGTDSGCHNTVVIGEQSTWSTVTIVKPSAGIGWEYEVIGGVLHKMKSGVKKSTFDALSEDTDIKHKAIDNASFLKLLDVYLCKNPSVKLFWNPVTQPNTYILCSMLFPNIMAAAQVYRLNKTGRKDVTIKLSRAFE